MFITSAPSRLPASSNEDWVRVEASKNRLICVRPRSDACFFSIWRLSSTNSLGEIEQTDDVLARKPLDPQQMPLAEDERGPLAQCSLKRTYRRRRPCAGQELYENAPTARRSCQRRRCCVGLIALDNEHGSDACDTDDGSQPVAAVCRRRSLRRRSPAAGRGCGERRWRAPASVWSSSAGIGARPSMFDLARAANENPPKLRAFDAKGFRRDMVEFHPAYHHFMARKHRRRVACLDLARRRHCGRRAGASRARRALLHGWRRSRTGILCPITMTHAAVAALAVEPALARELVAENSSRAITIRASCRGGRRTAITLGMGMTEKQGGTDVRANTTPRRARTATATAITGHKWFMSAPMCDAFLVLAQAPGGLTCFLHAALSPGRQRQRACVSSA